MRATAPIAAGVALVAAGAGLAWWIGRDGPGPAEPERAEASFALPAPAAGALERAVAAEDFIGAAACGACHADQYAAWRGSTHGLAGTAEPRADWVIAAFGGAPIRFRDAVVHPEVVGSRYRFRTEHADGATTVLDVDGVVGGGHMVGGGTQGFLTGMDDGTWRFLPFDWSRALGAWFCNTGSRLDAGWLPITDSLSLADCGDWPPNRILGSEPRFGNCQQCHGSQITVRFDGDAGRFETSFTELSVNCESCHGPGRRHAEAARAGRLATASDPGIATLATASEQASLGVCFRCHSLKDAVGTRPYLPGSGLKQHYSLSFPLLGDAPLRPDGRVRTFAYQEGHLYSACYLDGRLTCTDCHDPHGQGYRDHAGRPLAGRFADGQCTSCHPSKASRPEAHTRHAVGSEASRCVTCHMPYLQQPEVGGAVPYARSDHTISIPRPAIDADRGIIGACAQCHADLTAAALQAAVDEWWGRPRPRSAAVARLIEAQGVASPAAAATLLPVPGEKPSPARFGVLAEFYERHVERDVALPPTAAERLRALALDPDADVAALALAALHLSAGEDEETRRFLHERLTALRSDPTRERLIRSRWSIALGQRGDRHRAAGRLGVAAATYARALEIEPGSGALFHALGIALAGTGDRAGAVRALRRSAQLDHGTPLPLVTLGSVLGAAGDARGAEAALRRAIAIDPHHGVAWFNLGNLMLRAGRLAEAAELYARAFEADPGNALAAFHRARALIRLGELEAALVAVNAGLRIDPRDPDGHAMRRDLHAALAR